MTGVGHEIASNPVREAFFRNVLENADDARAVAHWRNQRAKCPPILLLPEAKLSLCRRSGARGPDRFLKSRMSNRFDSGLSLDVLTNQGAQGRIAEHDTTLFVGDEHRLDHPIEHGLQTILLQVLELRSLGERLGEIVNGSRNLAQVIGATATNAAAPPARPSATPAAAAPVTWAR